MAKDIDSIFFDITPEIEELALKCETNNAIDKELYTKDENQMFRIIRASFNQRRKTLANGLRNSAELDFTKEKIEKAIETLGKGPSVRGEALTLEEFAKLSDALDALSE